MALEKKNIRNNLRYHRKMWGYSLRDVATLLGISYKGQVSKWERGIERPSLESLLSLAYIYRTPCEKLFEDYRQELSNSIKEREQLLQERLNRKYD